MVCYRMNGENMSFKNNVKSVLYMSLLSLPLTSCFHPPFNNFKKRNPDLTPVAIKASAGAVAGLATGGTATAAIIGASVGTATGAAMSTYQSSEKSIIKELQSQDIQFAQYGETRLLVVPTDHYFEFNSARLNDICYEGLNNIVNLLKFYPCSKIYVAAFTDDVGTLAHKRSLSQAQAEVMLAFLWANNIPSAKLQAEGHADRHSIADNFLVHGSAMNRRIEIQWVDEKPAPKNAPIAHAMK